MPFERLHAQIRQTLASKGMVTPTHAQEEAIPEILNGSHVLLIAPTGIGKTEAAVLPILHNYLLMRDTFQKEGRQGEGEQGNPPGISILYVTPLRALNRDMLRRMREWGEALDISVAVRHGDTTQSERNRQSKTAPDFLITTPETLQIMLTGSRLIQHLSNVKWVIVDEIHEMAMDDRGAQLSIALERLTERAGEFQRIGLSATVGEPRKVGLFLTGTIRHVSIVKIESLNEKEVIVDRAVVTEEDEELSEKYQIWPELLASLKRAKELIEEYRSTLFFVNTRDTAEILSSRMKLLAPDLPVGIHHGSLSRDIRVEMEEGFKHGDLRGLICTSSMELGIDVGRTDLMIQYNSPRQVERFLQRLGRAGHRTDLISRGHILAVGPDEIAESMVIGRKSLTEDLETIDVRYNPLDVCANQLVAMTMEYRRIELKKAFEIFKRSFPFRYLKEETFLGIVDELTSAGVIWRDEEHFWKGKRSIQYFYSNISMIPDQRTYLIRDISTRTIVGTLDEAFAISLESKGTFIIKGNNWNFVQLEEGEVLVEPAFDLGILPDWVGEDIPVPLSVAREVGRIRRVLGEKTGSSEALMKTYPVTPEAFSQVRDHVDAQINKGISIPTDRLITIENGGKLCIVNCCFGSKINETLGQLFSALISARQGTAVRFTTDPYRVIMESSRRIDPNEIVEIIETFPTSTLRPMLFKVLRNSSYLTWQFFHVARKFGIISADADLQHIHMASFMDRFKDTVIYTEALNKVIWEKMDVTHTREALDDIQDGRTEIRITPVSPIGLEGLENRRELMNPDRASHTILKALKARLENNQMVLVCMNCGSTIRRRIKDLPQRISCSRCGSTMQAAISGFDRKSKAVVEKKFRGKKRLTTEERKEIRDLMTRASLVTEYGRNAVIVLSGRGVGPRAGGRILAKLLTDEYDMYREILKAEVIFARTNKFWA